MSVRIVDCVGDVCPMPVIKTKRAFAEHNEGEYEIRVDNDLSLQNVEKYVQSLGYEYNINDFVVYVNVLKSAKNFDAVHKSWILAIDSDAMGAEEALGRELMKSYIFALTQLAELPKTIVFYNSGALMTTKDSPILADLQTLSDAGVGIVVCGLCVQHYKLQERLGVGEISNMYIISEMFAQAEKVVKI